MSSVGHEQSLTMVSRLSLMAVSLALIVHPAINMRITSDHGSTEPYSSEATTESENSTCQKINNKPSGCPSEAKACVSLCCPPGVVSRGVRCVGGENTSDLPTPMIKYTDINFVGEADTSDGEFHPVEDDPCAISWMRSSIVEDFQIFKNASISAPNYDGGTVRDFGEYCLLLQDSKSDRMYLARMCRPWIQRGYYEISCVIISMVIMTAIFIVYTIVPELQNLHGLICRSYVVSYIGGYICALVAEYSTEVKERDLWFTVAHTSDLMDGVNRHQEVDKQWLSLYFKLFLLPGGHSAVIWAIWFCWMTRLTMCCVATVEVA